MVSTYFVGQGIKHPVHGWGSISKKLPDGTMTGRFRDGEHPVTEADLQTALEATPQAQPAPRGKRASRAPHKTAIAGQYKDFIDFARDHGTIRVQTPQHAAAKFNGDYESVTGDVIDTNTEYYSIIGGVYKWGATLTLLFPAEGAALAPPSLGAHLHTKDDPNTWCIMNNAFIFELFSIGFKLGKNHDKTVEIGLALTP